MLRFKTYVRYLEERMGFNALDNSGWRDRPERFDLVMSAIGKIKLIRATIGKNLTSTKYSTKDTRGSNTQ